MTEHAWIVLYPITTKSTYVYQKGSTVEKENTIYHPRQLKMLDKRYGMMKTDQKMSDPTERPSRISNVFNCVPIDRLLKKELRRKYSIGSSYIVEENVTIRDEIRNLRDLTSRILEDWVFEPVEINHTRHHIAHIVTTLEHHAERIAMLEGVYHERGDVYLEASTDLPFPSFSPSNAWSHYEPRYETRAVPERTISYVIDTETGACLGAVTKPKQAHEMLEEYKKAEEIARDTDSMTYKHPVGMVMKCKRYTVEYR